MDDDYASEEDSDFAPDNAAGHDSAASDDDGDSSDEEKPEPAKRKRGTEDGADFDNSGDEAVIEKGNKKKKRRKLVKGKKDAGVNAELRDDGGDGEGEEDVIKTRSMRAAEKAERKTATARGPLTVDVDALWTQMTSGAVAPVTKHVPVPATAAQLKQDAPSKAPTDQHAPDTATAAGESPNNSTQHDRAAAVVRIKRTYNFAGKVHTEEKLVARDSAEAKLYLASIGGEGDDTAPPVPKRMPRKAFRSRFEPVPDGGAGAPPRRADLDLGLSSARLRAEGKAAEAKKLNTVEKSRLDWAGFVDREGIQDELALAGRSKDSFATRQDFLARSEARREEEAWRVRMAGRAA